jgi:hypothetical protein
MEIYDVSAICHKIMMKLFFILIWMAIKSAKPYGEELNMTPRRPWKQRGLSVRVD